MESLCRYRGGQKNKSESRSPCSPYDLLGALRTSSPITKSYAWDHIKANGVVLVHGENKNLNINLLAEFYGGVFI